AQAFFTNNAVDLGAFTSTSNQVIDFNFDLVGSASGSGFAEEFLLGTTASPLSAQIVLSQATEGVPLASSTTVATFTDSNTSDAASDFTASINWGDGTTTTGIVAGSNGSFSVAGGHTYADEGQDSVVVTITHTADDKQIAATDTVNVSDAALTAE